MVNWPIFSDRHRSTAIPNFCLRKIVKLLECHFNTFADLWNHSAIVGVARVFQNLRKFAFLYGKIVGEFDYKAPGLTTVAEFSSAVVSASSQSAPPYKFPNFFPKTSYSTTTPN